MVECVVRHLDQEPEGQAQGYRQIGRQTVEQQVQDRGQADDRRLGKTTQEPVLFDPPTEPHGSVG
jgi:hypothetical protein